MCKVLVEAFNAVFALPHSNHAYMRAVTLFVSLTALALAGCIESVAPSDADVVGTWNLQSINGDDLPVIIEENADERVEMTADDLIIEADGRLSGSTTYRIVPTGGAPFNETFHQTGTWRRDGDALQLTINEDGLTTTATAAIGDDRLTFAGDGIVLVYVR